MITSACENMEKLETSYITDGIYDGEAALEHILAVPQMVEHSYPTTQQFHS